MTDALARVQAYHAHRLPSRCRDANARWRVGTRVRFLDGCNGKFLFIDEDFSLCLPTELIIFPLSKGGRSTFSLHKRKSCKKKCANVPLDRRHGVNFIAKARKLCEDARGALSSCRKRRHAFGRYAVLWELTSCRGFAFGAVRQQDNGYSHRLI